MESWNQKILGCVKEIPKTLFEIIYWHCAPDYPHSSNARPVVNDLRLYFIILSHYVVIGYTFNRYTTRLNQINNTSDFLNFHLSLFCPYCENLQEYR